jgi:hypothetical protein
MGRQINSWHCERFVIPLDQAWYCESCRAISNCITCCNCASQEHTQRLAPWLDREPISIPLSGVILSVTPAPKKRLDEANSSPSARAPRAA